MSLLIASLNFMIDMLETESKREINLNENRKLGHMMVI